MYIAEFLLRKAKETGLKRECKHVLIFHFTSLNFNFHLIYNEPFQISIMKQNNE